MSPIKGTIYKNNQEFHILINEDGIIFLKDALLAYNKMLTELKKSLPDIKGHEDSIQKLIPGKIEDTLRIWKGLQKSQDSGNLGYQPAEL